MSESADGDNVPVADLKECLECPVCMDVPKGGPIYQCRNGHILCKDCRDRITVCPSCKTTMGRIRSLLAEKILEKVPLPCPFEKNGCSKRISSATLAAHSSACCHRDVLCFATRCSEELPMETLAGHFKINHKVRTLATKDREATVAFSFNDKDFQRSPNYLPVHLVFEGSDYFLMLSHHLDCAMFQCWVYSFRFKEDLQNTRARIALTGSEIAAHEGPVVSAEIQPAAVKRDGLGLWVSSNFVKRSLVDQKIKVVIKILLP